MRHNTICFAAIFAPSYCLGPRVPRAAGDGERQRHRGCHPACSRECARHEARPCPRARFCARDVCRRMTLGEGRPSPWNRTRANTFLGENVLLHWRIRNAGEEPFKITFGGDGETPWAMRAIRLRCRPLTHKAGQPKTRSPTRRVWADWAATGRSIVARISRTTFQLMRYREFVKSGVYTIKVYHDLGWGRDKKPFVDSSADIPVGPLLRAVAQTKVGPW